MPSIAATHRRFFFVAQEQTTMSSPEIVKFFYFSEAGCCGENNTAEHHQQYCDEMLAKGYTLTDLTTLGGLDDRRDSWEGTLIYHWVLRGVDRGDKRDK